MTAPVQWSRVSEDHETFQLGPFVVPRIWTGLWQLSSNAWGSAPSQKIRSQMASYAERGYTAFDMADHYGSSEILFGQFRNKFSNQTQIVGATKWCVFRSLDPTPDVVEAAVQERLDRMQAPYVDLLQFHWQDYSDKRYLTAVRHLENLQRRGRIINIGLCNFDALRTEEICTHLGPGAVATNQVQFSLVDVRPIYAMADVCMKHNVKLLTYGTMCGGFLSDQWLNKPEPDLYAANLTPSQRKYLDMILNAWGDWKLFQVLLSTLRNIGDQHGGVSIANVAVRWVLDHPFVGAVIIGARMGLTEHTDDNRKVYSLKLSEKDRIALDAVLERSNGRHLITSIGDCGAEYR